MGVFVPWERLPDGTRKPRPLATFCICDGLPMDTHDRCSRCGILVGPSHLSMAVNERGLCTACESFDRRNYGRWDAPYQAAGVI